MADIQHGGLTFAGGPGGIDGIHVGQNWVFASEAMQNAQVVSAADVGKMAFRTDQSEMWAAVTAGTGIANWRHVTEIEQGANSSSQDSTTSATFQTKASAELLPINGTWFVFASALVSMSNTSGNGTYRVRETTADAALMTRNWISEMQDALNVLSPFLVGTITTTTADSPTKIVALQYAVDSGGGTLTISDAIIRAVLSD